MSLHFVHPLLLTAFVPLALAGVAIRNRFGPATGRWGRLWTALEWGALVLLVLALARPQSGAPGPETVLAVDRSASIDANMRATEDAWVREIKRSRCPEPCRVVQFAATPQPLSPSAAAFAPHAPTPATSDASDIAAGIDAAVPLLAHGGRAIVVSDGWQTAGDWRAAAARARAADVQLDFVRLTDRTLRDAAIIQLDAPPVVHAGDSLPLRITVRSTIAGRATLSVERDGAALGSQVVNLRTGDNHYLLSYTAPAQGWHSFTARISLAADSTPANNALAATVDVVPVPRVLEVAQAGSAGAAAVASILRRHGLAVTGVTPARLPTSPSALRRLEAVVFDDVPAGALDGGQVAALSRSVVTGGLGLMVLGGPHSFSLGAYANTGLERLLPVASLVPGNLQRGNLAVELVLDHSGSMIDLLGGIPKIQAVHSAGTDVAQVIAAHHAGLGIVDFDIAPHVLVPMQRLDNAADERQVIARVDGLQASGGTNIYAGLSAGLRQLGRSRARDKHVILMTDGISEAENYAPLLAALHRDHIQVATVALGSDADITLLRHIAAETGGHYYYAANAHSLPTIFYRETQFAVKPVRVGGHVSVTVGEDSPVIRSLAGTRLPALDDNVVTMLKPGAQADLLATGPSSQPSPALAQWQDGAGRVAVFTPGVGAPFATAWSREVQLWNDAVRWVERGPSVPLLTPTAVPGAPPSLEVDLEQASAGSSGVSAIHGSLQSTTGTTYPIKLARVGPGLYRAPMAATPRGVYGFALAAEGVNGLTATGLVAVPYSLEYLPRPAADTPLAPVAELTGGRELNPDQPGWLAGPGPSSLWWPLALAALVLFIAGAIGRQLERPPRDSYGATSPASRADLESRSSTDTSVGASTYRTPASAHASSTAARN